jgi:hypothetical protein
MVDLREPDRHGSCRKQRPGTVYLGCDQVEGEGERIRLQTTPSIQHPEACHSPLVLHLIAQLQTLDLNLALALVLENPRVGLTVDGRLGDLVQVVLVPLMTGECAARLAEPGPEGRVVLNNVATRAAREVSAAEFT